MAITTLGPDEELTIKRVSASTEHKNKLSVFKGGFWAPITFDTLDYIDCNCVVSHKAIVTDDLEDDNFDSLQSYFTIISSLPQAAPDDSNATTVLEPDEKPEVFYNSSISQHSNKLSIMQKGEWVPLSYDVLDFIDCNCAVSHKAIVTDGDDIGFNFDVSEQKCYTDVYIYHDRETVELRKLPHWFGEGYYEAFVDEAPFINADNESLGIRNVEVRRIGKPYALAIKTLEADD